MKKLFFLFLFLSFSCGSIVDEEKITKECTSLKEEAIILKQKIVELQKTLDLLQSAKCEENLE